MNLQEMGDFLRQERERKGMSLSDVVEKTKISRNNIEAIEDGKRDRLPHPVYARGFVKNYAGVLGLNPDDLVDVVKRELGREDEEDEFENVYDNVPSLASKYGNSRKRVAGTIISILLLAGLGTVAFMWYEDESLFSGAKETLTAASEPAAPESASPEATNDVVAESPAVEEESKTVFNSLAPVEETAPEQPADLAAVAEELAEADAVAPSDSVAPEELEVVSEEALADSAVEEAASAAEPEAAVQESAPVEPAPVRMETASTLAPGEGSVLEITAKEVVWTLATIDGDTVKDFTLKPGQSITLRYKDSLKVKFGNAGGVDLRLNGEDYAVNAASGQVKTLRFQ